MKTILVTNENTLTINRMLSIRAIKKLEKKLNTSIQEFLYTKNNVNHCGIYEQYINTKTNKTYFKQIEKPGKLIPCYSAQ